MYYYKIFRREPYQSMKCLSAPISSERVTHIQIHTYISRVADDFIHSSRDTYRK